MRNKHDKSEIYNELVWNNYKRNEIHMKWKVVVVVEELKIHMKWRVEKEDQEN